METLGYSDSELHLAKKKMIFLFQANYVGRNKVQYLGVSYVDIVKYFFDSNLIRGKDPSGSHQGLLLGLPTMLDFSAIKYKYANMQECKYWSFKVCKYAGMKVCKYAYISEYASVHTCKYACMQVFMHARIIKCKYESIQVCKYASLYISTYEHAHCCILHYMQVYKEECINTSRMQECKYVSTILVCKYVHIPAC